MLGAGRRIASAVDAPLPTSFPLAYHGALVFSTIPEAFGATPRQVTRDRLLEGAADWVHRCFLGAVRGVATTLPLRRAKAAGGPRRRSSRRSPPTPPPLGRKAARSRARLLEAAQDVFGNLGYEGTRVDDIASAASMSHGTFYRYFSGKEEVFREVATPAVEDALVLLEELPDPRGGLHAWSRRLYQTYSIHRGLFSAWAESEPARAVLEPELALEIAAAVEAALGQRAFGDVEVDALLLLSHVERAPYIARTYPRIPQPDAIADRRDPRAGLLRRREPRPGRLTSARGPLTAPIVRPRQAGLRLNRLKEKYGFLDKATADRTEKRILMARKMIGKVDEIILLPEPERTRKLLALKETFDQASMSTVCDKEEIKWPVFRWRLNFPNILRAIFRRHLA